MLGNAKKGSAKGGTKAAVWGLCALALVFGFALVGCGEDNDDDDGPSGPPTATIKLEQDDTNTVKLTLSGATWKAVRDLDGVLHSGNYLTKWVKTGGNTDSEPTNNCYTYERVSDTELKAVIDSDYNNATFKGTVELRTNAELAEEESRGTLGAVFLYTYTKEGKYDDNTDKCLGTLTVAEGSETVNINTVD